MDAFLAIECDLLHDDDGVVRYAVQLSNLGFSARTLAWGNDDEHLKFASALEGFPASSPSEVRYRFGTPGTGACDLQFFCLDGSGHVGVWANLESEYPTGRPERHEQATIFMRCDPASIDSFVASLRRFVAGSPNRAELTWLGP